MFSAVAEHLCLRLRSNQIAKFYTRQWFFEFYELFVETDLAGATFDGAATSPRLKLIYFLSNNFKFVTHVNNMS